MIDEHERRVSARVAQERRELAEHAQAYIEIANAVDTPSLSEQRIPVVLAFALGARPGDPLGSLLEEIRLRCITLQHTARAGNSGDACDVLEAIDHELMMLQTRAEVAGELVRRFGGLRDLLASEEA